MKLYVTRHGETPMNAAHRVCGRTDIDLTEKGVAQAIAAGESLKDKGIRRIIASPMLLVCHGSAPLPGAIRPKKGQIAANRSLADLAVLPNVYG
ncbi:histidine phosphatase family protein [Anaeromassilibacillus senegalensis]|uniref:Histidine phosphatase family protein n=1 Tax=Anaeromassilibacillus senegalensis TaxID=1673717 RepID=A0ABS9CPD1_9FIRM|nr:histidine phosphatase family protein [Anaeromassilibacillus senegalensis]MCF2652692.1 histidine phosphatase family protein [Anaeromassilibacillus senegalensis]